MATEKVKNLIWGAAGVVVTGLVVSAWDHVRPMTKVEHDADIAPIADIADAVRKIDRHWDCYEIRSSINDNLQTELRTAIDDEELRQLRESLKAQDCASL